MLVARDADSVAALDKILKNAGNSTCFDLLAACSVASREKRLEDAGFLMYVAGFRAGFDRSLFPPDRPGGEPVVFFGVLSDDIDAMLTPAIMDHPDIFAKIIARVKSWQPLPPDDYNPGWRYSKIGDANKALARLAGEKDQFLKKMEGFSTLMRDRRYCGAYEVCRSYQKSGGLTQGGVVRPKALYGDMLRTMQSIEKQKGIEGLSPYFTE